MPHYVGWDMLGILGTSMLGTTELIFTVGKFLHP
jgi:hypothetical protein